MTKLHDKSSPHSQRSIEPAQLLAAIDTFLRQAKRPAVVERGDRPIPIVPGQYLLDLTGGKVRLEVWGEERSLSRRVLSATAGASGVLDCTIQLFGGQTGQLSILDLERPQTLHRSQRATREVFSTDFRRMLTRQFPGWEMRTVSSSKDLRRSFSASFPRAELSRGSRIIAACACPSSEAEPEFLSFALLWHDFVCSSRKNNSNAVSLCLFLPEGCGTLTSHRLRWLGGRSLFSQLFLFNQHGLAGEVHPDDLGNLETRLTSQYTPVDLPPELKSMLAGLLEMDGLGCCPEVKGSLSIRSRGLEFARFEKGSLLLGLEEKSAIPLSQCYRLEEFAAGLLSLQQKASASNVSLASFPERWLETTVRNHLPLLDPSLRTTPVHGQVLTLAGVERELIDLLAVDHSGRLSVIELKASEDIHFPLQALDYWAQVRRHAERSEMDHLFPGMRLSKEAPRLLLIAPALCFHPANEIVLRYFSPDIDVERVGVNTEWHNNLKVLFRLKGAEVPISHQSFYEFDRPH